MPAYNEEASLSKAVSEIAQTILDKVPRSELVVVNDGSRDRTKDILDTLARQDARIRVIHQPNAGHGPALIRGLSEASGDLLFVIDSDRQIPIENFQTLWSRIGSCDAIFGVRTRRDDPIVRLILTRLVRLAILTLFGVWIRDANCPFKLFRRNMWLNARTLIPDRALTPSLLIAIFACRHDVRVCHVEVSHLRRSTGTPSLHLRKLLRFCRRAFVELLSFWIREHHPKSSATK